MHYTITHTNNNGIIDCIKTINQRHFDRIIRKYPIIIAVIRGDKVNINIIDDYDFYCLLAYEKIKVTWL